MFHFDHLFCFSALLATILFTRKSWIGLLITIGDSVNTSSTGLRTSEPNSVPANLSSIRVCAFGIQPGIKKQAQIDRVQARGKDRGLATDGSRTSPATMFRTPLGTRRLPSDPSKITAIKTTVDRFTYLAPRRPMSIVWLILRLNWPPSERLKIEPSALFSNGGIPQEPALTQSKTQVQVIRFVSPDHRGNIDTTL